MIRAWKLPVVACAECGKPVVVAHEEPNWLYDWCEVIVQCCKRTVGILPKDTINRGNLTTADIALPATWTPAEGCPPDRVAVRSLAHVWAFTGEPDVILHMAGSRRGRLTREQARDVAAKLLRFADGEELISDSLGAALDSREAQK